MTALDRGCRVRHMGTVHFLHVPAGNLLDEWDDELSGHPAVGCLRHLTDKFESLAQAVREYDGESVRELKLILSNALVGRMP